MQNHEDSFNFSDYLKNPPLYSEKNKTVIRKFKDELNGKIICEFVNFKAKMNSIKPKDGKNGQREYLPMMYHKK